MKSYCLILVFFLWSLSSVAQIHHFEVAKSFTQYFYKNSLGENTSRFTPVNGNKFGFFLKTNKERLFYGLNYQEQNTRGGNGAQIYEWETRYIGPQLKWLLPSKDKLQISLSMGTMFLLQGIQYIDGTQIQLKKNKEFNGLWFHPAVALNYSIIELTGLAIKVNYQINPSFKLGDQGREKLYFLSHHFGVQFSLINPTKELEINEE